MSVEYPCGVSRWPITVSNILQHFPFVLVAWPYCNNGVIKNLQTFCCEHFVLMTQEGIITVTTEYFRNKTILALWAFDSKSTLAILIPYDWTSIPIRMQLFESLAGNLWKRIQSRLDFPRFLKFGLSSLIQSHHKFFVVSEYNPKKDESW